MQKKAYWYLNTRNDQNTQKTTNHLSRLLRKQDSNSNQFFFCRQCLSFSGWTTRRVQTLVVRLNIILVRSVPAAVCHGRYFPVISRFELVTRDSGELCQIWLYVYSEFSKSEHIAFTQTKICFSWSDATIPTFRSRCTQASFPQNLDSIQKNFRSVGSGSWVTTGTSNSILRVAPTETSIFRFYTKFCVIVFFWIKYWFFVRGVCITGCRTQIDVHENALYKAN